MLHMQVLMDSVTLFRHLYYCNEKNIGGMLETWEQKVPKQPEEEQPEVCQFVFPVWPMSCSRILFGAAYIPSIRIPV